MITTTAQNGRTLADLTTHAGGPGVSDQLRSFRKPTVLRHWWTARLGRQGSDQTCVIVGGVKHPLFGTTAHRHTASSSTEIGAAMPESDV